MRLLSELVMPDATAWAELREAVSAAPHPVEVLPADPERAGSCLQGMQITTRSWLGAVIFHTGGILVGGGWLRVYGSGRPDRSLDDLVAVNARSPLNYVIADDVLGGRFRWWQDAPELPPSVRYFGPDELEWQDLQVGYAQWLAWMLSADFPRFYENLRWDGCEAEVSGCPLDHGISAYPPPWTVEGRDIAAAARKPVPLEHLIAFHLDAGRQLALPDPEVTN
jgi:hypothetical protein